MLNGTLTLHDIRDTEAFCAAILERSNLPLSEHEHEDALAFLVESAWELSLSYEPGDKRFKPSFSRNAIVILRRRLVDWQRQRYGRTRWSFAGRVYERVLPGFVPIDDRPEQPDHGLLDHADAGGVQDLLGLQRARGGTGAGPVEAPAGSASRSAA